MGMRLVAAVVCIAALVGCDRTQTVYEFEYDDPTDPSTEPTSDPTDPTDTDDEPLAAPQLEVAHQTDDLTDLAQQAVALAPAWLRHDLASTLAEVGDTTQDELGAILVDLDNPWLTDEIAFSIANISPEVLTDPQFYPELLVVNAESIYANDPVLQYVELVETGEPGVDDDYYTTTRYQVEIDGVVMERTIDRETYYWYVVHPRMEDESPYYIDAWASCGSSQCPTTPDDGTFWRTFLWDGAAADCPEDRECPVLLDYLTTEPYLWKGKANNRDDNGAIGAIIRWQKDAMVFGAGSERPIQPNRIYAVACGNCGEWSDMATAAARTGLIPGHNVGAYANDHTWNEFWDEGWQQWEPVNTWVLHYTYYVDSAGNYGRTLDAIDNDCDGTADEGLPEQPGSGSDDATDGDGDGYTVVDGDCDDTDPDVFPGAVEVDTNLFDDDCDGIAADPIDTTDLDGDSVSVADGDCNDLEATVYPGATEVPGNLIDDDCDGTADDGLDTTDLDGDGYDVADGDCNDTDAAIYPGATEVAGNLVDDDCDGVTDADIDRDGFTIADGDCDDERSDVHPDRDDPPLSSNRLFAMSNARGDSKLTTARTEAYGSEAYIAVEVVDGDGKPVDGAVVWTYGNWAVYGYPDIPAWAGEEITGSDGIATFHVGEGNSYGFSVESRAGYDPDPGYFYGDIIPWTEAGMSYEAQFVVDGSMPDAQALEETDLFGDDVPTGVVSVSLTGSHARIMANGIYTGSSSTTVDPTPIDVVITDGPGYDAFAAGDAVPAQHVFAAVTDVETEVELPLDRNWYVLVLNQQAIATTWLGDISVTIEPVEGAWADAGTSSMTTPVRVQPEDHFALRINEID